MLKSNTNISNLSTRALVLGTGAAIQLTTFATHVEGFQFKRQSHQTKKEVHFETISDDQSILDLEAQGNNWVYYINIQTKNAKDQFQELENEGQLIVAGGRARAIVRGDTSESQFQLIKSLQKMHKLEVEVLCKRDSTIMQTDLLEKGYNQYFVLDPKRVVLYEGGKKIIKDNYKFYLIENQEPLPISKSLKTQEKADSFKDLGKSLNKKKKEKADPFTIWIKTSEGQKIKGKSINSDGNVRMQWDLLDFLHRESENLKQEANPRKQLDWQAGQQILKLFNLHYKLKLENQLRCLRPRIESLSTQKVKNENYNYKAVFNIDWSESGGEYSFVLIKCGEKEGQKTQIEFDLVCRTRKSNITWVNVQPNPTTILQQLFSLW